MIMVNLFVIDLHPLGTDAVPLHLSEDSDVCLPAREIKHRTSNYENMRLPSLMQRRFT